jgi:hypothetical protein
MLRLSQAPTLFIATLWVDALKGQGIDATVLRQYLSSAVGELPPDVCLPEIWIQNPRQEEQAREVLQHMQNMPQQRWLCRCGERVEGGFQQCWNCSTLMPS